MSKPGRSEHQVLIHQGKVAPLLDLGRFEVSQVTRLCKPVYPEGGGVEKDLEKTTLITPNRESSPRLHLPVIGSLVYCESDSLDHAATKADQRKLANALVVLSCSTSEDGEIEVRISIILHRLLVSSVVTQETPNILHYTLKECSGHYIPQTKETSHKPINLLNVLGKIFKNIVYAEDEIEGADDDYYDSLSDTDGKQNKGKKEKPQPFQSDSFNFNFSMDEIVGETVGGDATDVKDRIKDYHSRKVRETGLGHRAPVPIITESYGNGIGRANSSEGLKLYESLSSNGGRNPRKHNSAYKLPRTTHHNDLHHVNSGLTDPLVGMPIHSLDMLAHSLAMTPTFGNANPDAPAHSLGQPQLGPRTLWLSLTVVNTVWSSKPPVKKYLSPTDIPLLTRQSRVMQTDSSGSGVPLIIPYTPIAQHKTKYQEQKSSPVTVVHSGGKNRQRRLKTERINPALETLDEQTTSRPTRTRQLVVAHYHGDTSRYSTDHPYYDGWYNW
uniref:(California timema) hypothetical protein n=1 Tax=Timema californicum TaxID=61474 RepID=A0A7R9J8W4_TIMCA|nr:unnamed protein product [Timema californicum]